MQIERILLLLLGISSTTLVAQDFRTLTMTLPDVEIFANKIVRGDGDTYGLGTWTSTFRASLEEGFLKIDGEVIFSENANDFTTIVGEYHTRIALDALAQCGHCQLELDETVGAVSGANIGARGFQWFGGRGLIRRAYFQTDTFGSDVGRIGGTIQFNTLKIRMDCRVASVFLGHGDKLGK